MFVLLYDLIVVYWLFCSIGLHVFDPVTSPPPTFTSLLVTPEIRPCMPDEHRCGDGTCILMEYLCDNRPDCRDMSDETNCGEWLQLGQQVAMRSAVAWNPGWK